MDSSVVDQALIPSTKDFVRGYKAFQRKERRDAMYKTASFLVEHYWGKPKEMADGLGVLLLTWNQAFYRYGLFNFDRLERCVKRNQTAITSFRARNILDLQKNDLKATRKLFNQFLNALAIAAGSKRGVRSPVAAAKALHLMAPQFFPLWDDKIARAYGCYYSMSPAGKYLEFMAKTFVIAKSVGKHRARAASGKSLVKLIDEYNYAKYTKAWV